MEEFSGRIHSIESFGTKDGPGIRTVVFFSGCPLRCLYCHNIDVAVGADAKEITVDELLTKVLKNRAYLGNGGGVTISGGEPFFQPVFLREFLKSCTEAGLHTAIDTSIYTSWGNIEAVLPYTDLFMVSIKQLNPVKHVELTGGKLDVVWENLRKLSDRNARIWLKYVLIPGMTDSEGDLVNFQKMLNEINFEQIEILPYHKFGVEKWRQLGMEYLLNDVPEPNKLELLKFSRFVKKLGYKVKLHGKFL